MKKSILFAAMVLMLAVVFCGAMSPLSVAFADAPAEVRYVDAQMIAKASSRTIYYTTKDMVVKETDGSCPRYYAVGSLSNACGAVAGAEVVGFYDKYYPSLIPDWTSYYETTGKYRAQNSTYVGPLMVELSDLMETNVGGDGVTEASFKSGLQKYANNQGRSLSYTEVAPNKKLDYNACVNAINSNKVIVLFTTAGDIYNIALHDGYDTISTYSITNNHIMVAYGYVELRYYTNSTLTDTELFLVVATGYSQPSIMYYKYDAPTLEAASIVNVA